MANPIAYYLRHCLSQTLSRVTLSQSLLHSIWFTSTRRARTRAPAWSHEILAPALLGRGTRARRQRHKLWSGSQRPRKRPIEGQSLHTKRTIENPSGSDCYTGLGLGLGLAVGLSDFRTIEPSDYRLTIALTVVWARCGPQDKDVTDGNINGSDQVISLSRIFTRSYEWKSCVINRN